MKIKSHRSLLAGAAFALASFSASANTITVDFVSAVGGSYTYSIIFSNTELPASGTPAYFELVDVDGYVAGSAVLGGATGFAPAGPWTITTPAMGTGVGPLISGQGDSAAVNNLLFTWAGLNVEVPVGTLSLTFTSTVTTQRLESFSSQDRVLVPGAPLGIADGGSSGAGGALLTPGSPNVPDGGTTVALLGSALVGLAALRRKVRAL